MGKLTLEDKIIQIIIYIILIILALLTLYPFWNTFVISINNAGDTANGGVTIWPRVFTLANYKVVLQNPDLLQSFFVTVLRTVIGTFLSIMFTSAFAFGLSRKGVFGKKFYTTLCLVTMYFSGGIIPYYLLIVKMHMNNTFWVMVIPGIVSVYNMIVFRSFFMSLPESMIESAKIDGANHITIFFRLILPLSGSIIATLALFTAVGHWNDWFYPSLFITSKHLYPLQSLLNQILATNAAQDLMNVLSPGAQEKLKRLQEVSNRSMAATTIMVVTSPIIMVYPFVQRYFVKGVLIGSLKE